MPTATNGTDEIDPTDDQREAEQEQVFVTSYERKVFHTNPDCPQIENKIWDTRPRDLLESWGGELCAMCDDDVDRKNEGPQLAASLKHADTFADAVDDYHDRQAD